MPGTAAPGRHHRGRHRSARFGCALAGYPQPTHGPLGTPSTAPLVTDLTPSGLGWAKERFGYLLAIPGGRSGQWNLELRDPAGAAIGRCQLANRGFGCVSG